MCGRSTGILLIEIFAVMEGRLDFFVNKEEYPLKAGEQTYY